MSQKACIFPDKGTKFKEAWIAKEADAAKATKSKRCLKALNRVKDIRMCLGSGLSIHIKAEKWSMSKDWSKGLLHHQWPIEGGLQLDLTDFADWLAPGKSKETVTTTTTTRTNPPPPPHPTTTTPTPTAIATATATATTTTTTTTLLIRHLTNSPPY